MKQIADTRTIGGAVGYLATLDGLRGVAVAMVLWHHVPLIFCQALYSEVFWRWSHGGALGVDLFFVLSGYLITTILRRGRGEPQPLRTFWARRALRIFPLFYLYMLINCLLLYAAGAYSPTGQYPHTPGQLALFLVYLTNVQIVRTGWYTGEFNVLWSLAIEEQFYLLWPFVVLALSRRALVRGMITLLLLAPLVRLLSASQLGLDSIYVLPMCHGDGLLFGALLAVLLEDPRHAPRVLHVCRRAAPVAALGLGIVLFGPLELTTPGYMSGPWLLFGYSVIALCFTVLVAAVVLPGPGTQRLLANRPITYLGRISYGLYLWHWLVGDLLLAALTRLELQGIGLTATVSLWLVLTLLTASMSWHLFERPILKWKQRFSYGPVQTRQPGLSTV